MSLVGKLAEAFSVFAGSARANLDGVDTDAVISSRDVVKEGWLTKQSRNVKEWRKRYVVLTKDCLATFRNGPQQVYKCIEATELVFFGHMMTVRSAEQDTGMDNSFCMQRQKDAKFFYFIAETATEKEGWVGAIGRQMVQMTCISTESFFFLTMYIYSLAEPGINFAFQRTCASRLQENQITLASGETDCHDR
ncbi:unnamed protein product [Amoebophrya sp. A120]|nr:unnamed protein product [Amoebophrya sp. A120]|eukprot:GSA120T00011519001.1